MKFAVVVGILIALVLHAGVILVGGLVFGGLKKDQATLQVVDLLSDDIAAEKEKERPKEPEPEKAPEIEPEKPPDAAEIIRSLELPDVVSAPALEAVSLSAIEAALGGQLGGGDFASSLSFSSGGRIGGTGNGGATDEKLDDAFSLAEIDQRPRATFQSTPMYPAEMRGKKTEGAVTVVFVVDPSGKVTNPRVEKSSHAAFERAALEAVTEIDAMIVGQTMVTTEWSDWRSGFFWWIQSVYVSPQFRRRGVFRALHMEVREAARKSGDVCGLRLYVHEANARAMEAYMNMGMERTHYAMFEEDWSHKG